MKLISIRSQIKEVSDRWKESYLGHTWMGQNKKEIFDKLKKLDPETATKEDVANIVGNYSWAKEKQCYECGEYFETVINSLKANARSSSVIEVKKESCVMA